MVPESLKWLLGTIVQMPSALIYADVSTNGRASVYTKDQLFADASTAGEVWYIGTPTGKQSASTGGGIFAR